jgi:hypothetical protein
VNGGIFGPSIDSDDVERAVITHLQSWLPIYIPAIRRIKDPNNERWPEGVAAIRSYSVTHYEGHWPENQIPALVVQSPGEVDDPRTEEDGRVIGFFGVSIMVVCEGGGEDPEDDAKTLSRLYASAIRMAMMQHPDLSGFSNAVGMGPELNDAITRGVEAERSLAGSVRRYVVEVENVVNLKEGPLEPLEDPEAPPDGWPHVKEGGATATVDALRSNGFFD